MLFNNYFLAIMSVLDRDNIVNELYNPTYFFPIIGVLLSGLTVYIFGFTKTTKNPPTLQLLAYDKEDKKTHNQLINRKEKSKAKDVKKVNSTSSKQKSSNEKVNHHNHKVDTSKKPTSKVITPTTVNKKESRKAKESIDSAIDVSTDGQWIEAISRKKSRKMKEEAAKSEAAKNEAKKRPVETQKMNGDAGKDEVKASSPKKSDIKSDEPKTVAMSSAATKKRRARLE